MALTTIINIILAVILIVCAWIGFREGIIMGVLRILVIVLAVYGAQLVSNTFSYEVISVVKPFVSGYMQSQIETNAYQVLGYEADENGNYNVDYSLDDLLETEPLAREEICRWTYKSLGVYDDMAENLTEKTVTYMDQNNASIDEAIEQIVCQTICWYGAFMLAFIILFALLTVIINLPNLSFRIPYIGIVNDIGGLAIGIFVAAMLCSLIVWLLQFLGLVLPSGALQSGGAITYFLNHNMLSNYITF